MQESARTARQARLTLAALELEIPETAATLRLSGLELSDCIEEMSGLRCDSHRLRAGYGLYLPEL